MHIRTRVEASLALAHVSAVRRSGRHTASNQAQNPLLRLMGGFRRPVVEMEGHSCTRIVIRHEEILFPYVALLM